MDDIADSLPILYSREGKDQGIAYEVIAQENRRLILYFFGKNSAELLHLRRKADAPAPLQHSQSCKQIQVGNFCLFIICLSG